MRQHGVSPSPGYFAFNPAPCWRTCKGSRRWPGTLSFATHAGHPVRVPGSWLWPQPTLDVVGIWAAKPQMKKLTLSLPVPTLSLLPMVGSGGYFTLICSLLPLVITLRILGLTSQAVNTTAWDQDENLPVPYTAHWVTWCAWPMLCLVEVGPGGLGSQGHAPLSSEVQAVPHG